MKTTNWSYQCTKILPLKDYFSAEQNKHFFDMENNFVITQFTKPNLPTHTYHFWKLSYNLAHHILFCVISLRCSRYEHLNSVSKKKCFKNQSNLVSKSVEWCPLKFVGLIKPAAKSDQKKNSNILIWIRSVICWVVFYFLVRFCRRLYQADELFRASFNALRN